MSETRSYVLLDPAALAAKVKAAGGPVVDPSQATGEASAEGVTLAWSVGQGQIRVTIVRKPWVVADSVIWKRVDALFG